MSQRHLEWTFKVECVEGADKVLVGSEKCRGCGDFLCKDVNNAYILIKAVNDAIEGLKNKRPEVKQPLTWEKIFPFTSTQIYR